MIVPISLAKLFIHDTGSSRSHTDITLAHSDPHWQRRLVVIVDFPRLPRFDQSYLLEAITKECADWFQKTIQLESEQSLEKILEQLNYLLPNIIPKKNSRWLEQLNILIAIIDGRETHFAHLGQMAAWILHDNAFTLVSPSSKVINPLKLFSSCTSGDLDEDETLIFTTSSLTDYVSEVKIRQIISSGTTAEAVEKFELLLEQVPRFVSFAAVILKGQEEEALPQPPKIVKSPRTAVSATTGLGRIPGRTTNRPRPAKSDQPSISTNILQGMGWALKFFFVHAWLYLKLLGRFFVGLFQTVVQTGKFIIHPDIRTEASHRQWNRLESSVDKLHHSFRSKHWTHRWLIVACLILVLIILNVIIYRGQDLQLNKQYRVYSETLAQLGSMQSDVDASRVYNDDKKAESILASMLGRINQLTPQDSNQKKQLNDLRERIDRQLNEVRHINSLDTPLLYRDLTSLNQEFHHLAVINNIGYVSGAQGIYRLDETPKQIVAQTLNSGYLFNTSNNTLVLLNDRQLATISGSNANPAQITWNAGLQTIDQALLYGDNLYIVDKTSGTIYKHSGDASGTKYGNGTVWLKDQPLINATQSIAIDGNIWLIDSQGAIVKLFKGQRQQFDYQRPLPAFGNGSQIMTTKNSDWLYILDPANKRVAIMDKKGSIKDQFTSPKFDNLKSFAVDAAEKIIYLLNGDKIYQLAIKK
ncbi:MAG: hypothetical protein V1846_05050 [Candidatus Komeilibacteria bacterium]